MVDILIVGAGPAGLTAAIYARRAEKSVLVLEKGAPGGQIINTPSIENFPTQAHISGFDFADKLLRQAKELGAEIRFECVTGLTDLGAEKEVVTSKNRYRARCVILATGADCRKLGVAGEETLVGRGVSYCATCDGAFYRNKDVAVVGGGNTALEDALYLSDLAARVTVIHRRDAFRADESVVKRLKEKKNVCFCLNATVTALLYDKRLSGVEITDTDGKKTTLKADGLFIAVGRVPANDAFAPLVALDPGGYIVAGEDMRTGIPGVFAAGDNRTKALRQLVTAASDGAVAAANAVAYLQTL